MLRGFSLLPSFAFIPLLGSPAEALPKPFGTMRVGDSGPELIYTTFEAKDLIQISSHGLMDKSVCLSIINHCDDVHFYREDDDEGNVKITIRRRPT